MVCVSVIGYGYWGPNIVRNLLSMGRKVKYVVDIDKERCKEVKKKYPTVNAITDIDKAISDDEVDAVIIVLPAKMHYDIAKKALLQNKHVLVEKPLTTTSEEADELIALSEEKKLVLMVDHTYVYSPAIKKIKEIIEEQKLELRHVESIRYNLGVFRPDVDVLWDLAPHDLSIISYISELSPISIKSEGFSHTNNKLYDVASMFLKYPTFTATIHNSWISPSKIRTIHFITDKKIIVFNDLEKEEKITIIDAGFKTEGKTTKTWINGMMRVRTDEGEPLAIMLSDFIKSIETGKTPDSNKYLGKEIISTLEKTKY